MKITILAGLLVLCVAGSAAAQISTSVGAVQTLGAGGQFSPSSTTVDRGGTTAAEAEVRGPVSADVDAGVAMDVDLSTTRRRTASSSSVEVSGSADASSSAVSVGADSSAGARIELLRHRARDIRRSWRDR